MTQATVLTAAQARVAAQPGIPEVFAGRGLTRADLTRLGLGLDEQGNGVIALHDAGGQLRGLKLRLRRPERHKYAELPAANGNPPWFAPVPPTVLGVLCVEGELNAMVTWLSLGPADLTHWQVIGLGSTFGPVPWAVLQHAGQPVVFFLDQGRAGAKSLATWHAQAQSRGLEIRWAGPLQGRWDACEYAEAYGQAALGQRWRQILTPGR